MAVLRCAVLAILFAITAPAFAQHWSTAHGWHAPENSAVESEELLAVYKEFNREYFGGKLPETNVVVRWDASVELDGNLASSWMTDYEGEGERIIISISTRMEGCDTYRNMLLLHEMVHIKLRHRNDSYQHGKRFQKEMRRLVKLHAFDERW